MCTERDADDLVGSEESITRTSPIPFRCSGAEGANRFGAGPSRPVNHASADGDSDDSDQWDGTNLPKLTDAELAQAFASSRARSIPARSMLEGSGLHARIPSGEDVIVFGGIIDILQQYGARKKLEHSYKVIRYAGEKAGISVTSPPVYAKRFLDFMRSVFDPSQKHWGDAQPANPRASDGGGAAGPALNSPPQATSSGAAPQVPVAAQRNSAADQSGAMKLALQDQAL